MTTPPKRKARKPRKTRTSHLVLDPARLQGASLQAINQFCVVNPAFTPGAVRWSVFKYGKKLQSAGAIVRIGRRVLIRPTKYIDCVTGGKAA